jgi:hypothetical protein
MRKRDNNPTEPQSSPDTATYLGDRNFPSAILPAESARAPQSTEPAAPASAATPAVLSIDQASTVVHETQGDQPPATAELHLRQPPQAPTDAVVARLDFKPLFGRAE